MGRRSRVCWAALIFVGGCVTAPVEGPPAPVIQEPGSLEEQVENAAQLASEAPVQVVRYNPVKCACPMFEVRLGDRWVRVHVDGVDDPESLGGRLLQRAKNEADHEPPPIYSVTGDLSTSARRCGQGTLCLSLGVDAVE